METQAPVVRESTPDPEPLEDDEGEGEDMASDLTTLPKTAAKTPANLTRGGQAAYTPETPLYYLNM